VAELWRSLSLITRAFLTAYALVVAIHWLLFYAPGETFVELTEVKMIEPLPIINLTFLPATDECAMVALVGADAWWLLDWSRSEQLAERGELESLVATKLDLGWAPHQGHYSGGQGVWLAWEDGEHFAYRATAAGNVSREPAPQDALWVAPSGGLVRAGSFYDRTEQLFGKRPHDSRVWRAGRWALMRPAVGAWVEQDGRWSLQEVPAESGLLLFDAQTGEPRAALETLHLRNVFSPPSWTGFLYSDDTGSSLKYIACDEEHCRYNDVQLRTAGGMVTGADYSPRFNRIALCVGTSLLLYEGAPYDEDIVYLGQGTLSAPCNNVWIASNSAMLLQLGGGYHVARFREDG